jgi:hypothetical protein
MRDHRKPSSLCIYLVRSVVRASWYHRTTNGSFGSTGRSIYLFRRTCVLIFMATLAAYCKISGKQAAENTVRAQLSLFYDRENRGLKSSQSVVNPAFIVANKSPASSKYFSTLAEAAPGWARPPETPKALDPRFQFRGSLIKANRNRAYIRN